MKKSQKWLVGILGAVLILAVAAIAAKWWVIDRPIRSEENIAAVTELHVTMRKIESQNDCQLRQDSQVYQALADYLTRAVYLPAANDSTGDEDSRTVTLRYGNEASDKVELTVAFREGSSICQVNGKPMRIILRSGSAYQAVEKILREETEKLTLTVKETDLEWDGILAEKPETGEEYALHAVSGQLQTPEGETVPLEQLQPGDSIIVLCDGYALASYPYQIPNTYQIWIEK